MRESKESLENAREILRLREERDVLERSLITSRRKTLLTLRGNYPGLEKREAPATYVVEMLKEEVLQRFRVEEASFSGTLEGNFWFFLVSESGPEAKEKAVALEESHPLGRLADLDVRDSSGIYTRRALNLPERKCYLCPEDASQCVRSARHSLPEVQAYYRNQVEAFRKQKNEQHAE